MCAQQRQLIEYAQERYDLPDYNSLQDFIKGDFQLLNQKVLSGETYILSGFVMQHLAPPSLNVRIVVPNSVLINTSQDGTMFVAPGSSANIDLTLGDGTTTYIWLTLGSTDGVPAIRTFWDPNDNNGLGAEFNQEVNTVRELAVSVHTSTVGFPATTDVIHVAVATTAGGTVTALVDHRKLFFRLGRGGTSNNSSYVYPWASGRGDPNADLKIDANAFSGGDKQLKVLKDWMDAVMSQFVEIKGGGIWNAPPPTTLADDYLEMTGGGVFTWNLGANQLSFTADITFIIPQTAFTNTISSGASSPITINANGKVVYVDIDRTANAVLTPVVVDASAYMPQANRIIIVQRVNNAVYIGNS